jgi:CheY-like chemotaxis protein
MTTTQGALQAIDSLGFMIPKRTNLHGKSVRPVMDGLAAARALRAMPQLQALPILAMTANAYDEDHAACLAAGMDDFVAKPVEPQALYATLLKWLDRGSAAQAASASRLSGSAPGPA